MNPKKGFYTLSFDGGVVPTYLWHPYEKVVEANVKKTDFDVTGTVGFDDLLSAFDYHGAGNYTARVPEKYEPLAIADQTNTEKFKSELMAHQQRKTDYLTFIKMCAETGIEKWKIRMDKMTCTYYDKAGNEILEELIPQ